jgi:hypothetical protein
MLMPHEYFAFTIEAFYDEPNEDGGCTVSVYIEAPGGEYCQQIASGVTNWTEAKAKAEQAIDALIAAQH